MNDVTAANQQSFIGFVTKWTNAFFLKIFFLLMYDPLNKRVIWSALLWSEPIHLNLHKLTFCIVFFVGLRDCVKKFHNFIFYIILCLLLSPQFNLLHKYCVYFFLPLRCCSCASCLLNFIMNVLNLNESDYCNDN